MPRRDWHRCRCRELLYVREYIGKNHEFHHAHRNFHQVESVFRCSLPNPDGIGPGTEHDKKQIGVEWIPLEELDDRRFLPEVIKPFFTNDGFEPKLELFRRCELSASHSIDAEQLQQHASEEVTSACRLLTPSTFKPSHFQPSTCHFFNLSTLPLQIERLPPNLQ